jgi:parvulin-like peptidyl-prolyl isomerase
MSRHPLSPPCPASRIHTGCILGQFFALLWFTGLAAANAAAAEEASADRSLVAATVDGQPIRDIDIRRQLKQLMGEAASAESVDRQLQAEALEQLVNRRLVLRYLTRTRRGATGQELRVALQRLEARLAQQDVALEEYLRASGLDRAALREQLAWKVGWSRYLNEQLSDENLARFFEKHRRDFDGTEVRVAHILLKVGPRSELSNVEQAIDQARSIRQQIVSDELSFAAAAERFSQAPTATGGGDIGFVKRRDTMPEEFSQAAFGLDAGQISQPVVSSFGVHLIQCLEVKPGDKSWNEVRSELEPAATRYLFRWLADRERPKAKIEYTGAWPHFQPGTRILATEK